MTYNTDMKKFLLILIVLLNLSINSYSNDFPADIYSEEGIYIAQSNKTGSQADTYRENGYKKLDQAKIMLRRNRFDEAQRLLQEARESFRISLNFNNDNELRLNSDREVYALSEEIIRIKTSVLIETVRTNIQTSRKYYNDEKYDEAESLLIESQKIWRSVNADDNEEINYRLRLVKNAKSLRAGRVFFKTDPLHIKMIQVIELARNDYETAKQLAAQGKNEQAKGYLQSAEEKLHHVTDRFPLNQNASILSLEIQKIKDPENFKILFKEKFELARELIKTNPSESHIFLKDLAHINPHYPGLKDALYETEIKLGLRTPPPDPAKIREAEDLYDKANNIVSSNVRSNYPAALEYLNKAFALNPDNDKIVLLKDRIQAEMGGSTTVVLSPEAQKQFRHAEQEYINGNYYAAFAIVHKLLQDEKNRKYYPLLELKRRIDSKI